MFKALVPENVSRSVLKDAAVHTRRLDQLLRQFSSARDYQTETVHQVRILTRKCSACWRILCHTGIKLDVNKIKGNLSDLRGALGKLRDADIRLEEFQRFASTRKRALDDALAGSLFQVWTQCYEEAKEQLSQTIPACRAALADLAKRYSKLTEPVSKQRWNKQNDRWVKKQLSKWLKLTEMKAMDDQQMHALRIRTKRLRYLLQSLLPKKPSPAISEWLTRLESLQDALGKLRDFQNILEWLDRYQKGISVWPTPPNRLAASIKAWRQYGEQVIRRQNQLWGRLCRQLTRKSIRSR